MYCRHCGDVVNEENIFCPHCGQRLQAEIRYCSNCGETIDSFTEECPRCHTHVSPMKPPVYNPKSKMVAGLLGVFVGIFGIHNFYLGYSSKGFIQLMLFFCGFFTLGLTVIAAGIWGLVEGILILTDTIHEDADGNPLIK